MTFNDASELKFICETFAAKSGVILSAAVVLSVTFIDAIKLKIYLRNFCGVAGGVAFGDGGGV